MVFVGFVWLILCSFVIRMNRHISFDRRRAILIALAIGILSITLTITIGDSFAIREAETSYLASSLHNAPTPAAVSALLPHQYARDIPTPEEMIAPPQDAPIVTPSAATKRATPRDTKNGNNVQGGGGGAEIIKTLTPQSFTQTIPEVRQIPVGKAEEIRQMAYVQDWEFDTKLQPPPPYWSIIPYVARHPLSGLEAYHNRDYTYNLSSATFHPEYSRAFINGCGFITVFRAARESGKIVMSPPWYWDLHVMGYRTALLYMIKSAPDIVSDKRLTEVEDIYHIAYAVRMKSALKDVRRIRQEIDKTPSLCANVPASPYNLLCLANLSEANGIRFIALITWNPVLGAISPYYETAMAKLPAKYRLLAGHWVEIYDVEKTGDGYWFVRYYDPYLDREVLQWYGDFLRGWADRDFLFAALKP